MTGTRATTMAGTPAATPSDTASTANVVGREREVARMAAALAAGRSVVLAGKYGSGRTTLVHHLAAVCEGRFRFAFCDLSAPPRQAWAALAEAFAPRNGAGGSEASGDGPHGGAASSRALRTRVLRAPEPRAPLRRAPVPRTPAATARPNDAPKSSSWRRRTSEPPDAIQPATPPVVVLDDVGRLTAARFDLVRRLAVSGRFRFVAVLEGHLPADQRRRLLAFLAPVVRLRLGPLPPAAVRGYLARASAERGLGWSAEKIAVVALGTAGYPLAMRLALDRAEVGHP